MSSCPRCGAPLPDPAPQACPACGQSFVPAAGPAWEGPGAVPDRLLATTVAVLSRPGEFFARLPDAGPAPALGYAAILGGLILFVNVAMDFALQSLLGVALQQRPPAGLEMVTGWFYGAGALGMILMQVALFLARLFVWSAIAHGLLMIFSSPRQRFETTLRVFCYGHAAHLLAVLPFCGSVIGLVWFLVVVTIGVSETQGVGRGTVALAVLAPLLVCCCCCLAGAATILGPILAGLAAAAGWHPQ